MKFKLLPLLFFPLSAISQITGTWHTSFVVMGMSKRLDLILDLNAKDTVGWVRDPESKSTVKIPLDQIRIQNDSLHFSWTGGGLNFKGRYFPNGDTLNGVFRQSGLEWGAHFSRRERELIKPNRPQEPQPPFPYQSEDILIKNGDVTLAASLTLPNTGANFPIVVLASGSGAQDRNCDIMGHKPFLVIADHLARNGIGCLRFDDRGTGKSTGVYLRANLQDFASDVSACVHFLKTDDRFVHSPVGIAGHSEGGMHALIAAQRNKEVSFIVELASVGTSGLEVFLNQQYDIPFKENGDSVLAKWNREFFRGACQIVLAEKKEKVRAEKLNSYLDEQYVKAPEEIRKSQPLISFKIGVQMLINTEWFRQFSIYEASDYLKKLSIPILAINGGADVQVEPKENNQAFMNGFSKKSRPNSKAVIVMGLNHLMQHCKKCSVTEYGELEETFAPEVMQLMVEWLGGLPR